jgi:pyruvate/2-oxoglutarate dehydrogenase complex dihydrolipoamide dehydrogenase (E3) component
MTMEHADRYNLAVVGGGSGGLVVAAGAAGLGARVVLFEKHLMGGDCLNTGCVPSKALLRAAKAAVAARDAARFGIRGGTGPGVQDLGPVMDWVRSRRARIAPHDSVERFTGLGVDVIQGAGRLVSRNEVEGGGRRIRARHVVIATGSRPRVPDVPGLAEAGFLTNESVFEIDRLPPSLLVMGGGPIGVELGQAFQRLGSRVTIVSSSPHVCPKEDPDAAAALAARLRAEGVTILDGARATRVEVQGGRKVVTVTGQGAAPTSIEVDEILVAAGRLPNVEGLGLEAAGVEVTAAGIRTDASGRTSVPSVWAIGDVAGGPLFTHWAGHQARVVLRNALFPGTAACDRENLPWTTFTDPEIARVGLGETEAKERGVPHRVFRVPFEGVDRAVCDGEEEGFFAKVVASPKGKILGAAIVHPHAGDLLAELVLAKKFGIGLPQLSATIHTYPSLSEISRALGDAYQKTRLTPSTRSRLERVFAWLR